jgi:hypothetical protein
MEAAAAAVLQAIMEQLPEPAEMVAVVTVLRLALAVTQQIIQAAAAVVLDGAEAAIWRAVMVVPVLLSFNTQNRAMSLRLVLQV